VLSMGCVRAQRATVELGLLGGSYLATGLVALAQAAGDGRPEVDVMIAGFGVLVVVAAIWVIGLAVHRLNAIEGLPDTARRVSWLSVAARVALSSVLPVATVVALSMTTTGGAWILGVTYAVLGGAICATALLAGHVEHLCGARVWRARHRFYFAR
jgi:hypothetical protein